MVKVHTAVARGLLDIGSDTLFGLMGDASMQFIADYRDFGGRYISAVDERGAVAMADGFARMSKKVGLASVTHGPGFTNCLTSLVEAVRADTPLVVLTGETPSYRRHHSQWIEIAALVGPTGANYHRVKSPGQLSEDISRAFSTAWAEQRPFVLDIPADLLDLELDYEAPVTPGYQVQALSPDLDAVDVALGALASANRPLLLAGRGAVLAGARDDIVRLADRVGALLVTTVGARGLFDGHPRNLGIFGNLASSVGMVEIQQADCIVSIGASLNDYTTDFGSLVEGKRVIQCDQDATRIGRYRGVELSVVGDARLIAASMADQLEEAGFESSRSTDRIEERIGQYDPAGEFADQSGPSSVDIRTANIALNDLMPDEYAIVTDTGRYMLSTWRFLAVPDPALIAQTHNFGSIGLGLATAVGAATARPGELTLGIVGDGGGMMGLIEFSTAVRHQLPLAVIVFNDGSYGFEYKKLLAFGKDPKHSQLSWPDLSSVAQSLGGRGVKIESLDELRSLPAETWAVENLPVLIEVVADPAVETAPY